MWLKDMRGYLRTLGFMLMVLLCGGCFLYIITLLMLSMDGYSYEQNNAFTNLSFSISVPVVFVCMICLIVSFMDASTKANAKSTESKYAQAVGAMSKSKIIRRFVLCALFEILCIDNVWLMTKFIFIGKTQQHIVVFVVFIGFMLYLILNLVKRLIGELIFYKSLKEKTDK